MAVHGQKVFQDVVGDSCLPRDAVHEPDQGALLGGKHVGVEVPNFDGDLLFVGQSEFLGDRKMLSPFVLSAKGLRENQDRQLSLECGEVQVAVTGSN